MTAVYARSGAPPTRDTYDVLAPAGRTRHLVASPCAAEYSAESVTWHIAVELGLNSSVENRFEGGHVSLAPSTFELNAQLRSHVIAPNGGVEPLDQGGSGYVCCGGWTYFRFVNVSAREYLSASINVTSGAARALFLKAAACPTADDQNPDTGTCTGFCELDWLERAGTFSGAHYSSPRASVLIPTGAGETTDKRREGDWYLGVQAVDDRAAHFKLTSALEAVVPPGDMSCTRFTMCDRDPQRQAAAARAGAAAAADGLDDAIDGSVLSSGAQTREGEDERDALINRCVFLPLAPFFPHVTPHSSYHSSHLTPVEFNRVLPPTVIIVALLLGIWIAAEARRRYKRRRPLRVIPTPVS